MTCEKFPRVVHRRMPATVTLITILIMTAGCSANAGIVNSLSRSQAPPIRVCKSQPLTACLLVECDDTSRATLPTMGR